MSVSPISSSMMSMYVHTSGTSASGGIDYEYELIKQKLLALGLMPSGDKEADKAKLQIAERVRDMQKSQSSSSKQSIPFEDVMNTLNLSVSGDLDKDYDTTINRLDYEIDMAYTDEEKQYFEALKYQVETEYNSSKQDSVSAFSGADQISSMNRYMLGI